MIIAAACQEVGPGCRPSGSAIATGLDTADAAAIDSFVESAMAELGVVPGVTLAVVRDGEVVHEAGYGWRDRERRPHRDRRTEWFHCAFYTQRAM